MFKKIPYNKAFVNKKDINIVKKSLKTQILTSGPYLNNLEYNFQKKLNVKNSIACNSGTSALHLAFKSLNIKKSDIVILPIINFVAASNMLSLLGVKIYYADVDNLTGQMTPQTLKECIKKNKIKKIKAFVTMYLGGSPDNVVEFYKIKKKLKCYLIEDACHALGASYKYKNKSYEIGSCKHSDICTFSLHPLKSITSGEGGIVCTNNSLLAKNIKKIRSHGIQKNKKDGHWVYDVSEPGYNFRISEMNCALALSQLDKLDSFINLRKKISTQYINFFKSFEHLLKVRPCNSMDQNAWHLFVILVDFKKFKISKNDFFKYLLKKGIICQQHYMPLYEFSYYSHINRKNFINSSAYINSAISIPIYFELKKSKIKYICQIIKNFLTQNIIKDGI
tara:strand:- start:5188 stop:6366 length:1179 start_codon:yes stop_codon:yes gene_type:complete